MISDKEREDFKQKLEKEKALLESELQKLGARNTANPSDWVPAKGKGEEFGADRNENADIIEDMHDDNASLNKLEGRLNTVLIALENIEKGTYGTCEISGEPIEKERLLANPAARTCVAHIHEQLP